MAFLDAALLGETAKLALPGARVCFPISALCYDRNQTLTITFIDGASYETELARWFAPSSKRVLQPQRPRQMLIPLGRNRDAPARLKIFIL